MPSEEELTTIESMVQVLELLSYFTDALSGEFHVTVSAMRPLLSHILNTNLLVSPEDSANVSQMKNKIKEYLESQYSNSSLSQLLDKCSYLDPRFRGKYLTDKEKATYQVKMEAIEMLQQNDTKDVAVEVEVAASEVTEILRQKRMIGLSAVLQHCLGCNSEDISNEERVDREINDMKNIHQWN